jgi:hypothetical protein
MAAPTAACGHSKNEQSAAGTVALPPATQPAAVPGASYGEPATGVDTSGKTKPKHHSKIAGAVVQHERNKHKK